VLAPAGYDVDPDLGSDPERPWRLIQGLTARGIRVIAVARRVARSTELGPLATIRLLPGSQPTTPTGRLLDRLRLYLYARAVVMREMERSVPLAAHHFGPCSHGSPSLVPRIAAPFVYGPMPAKHPDPGLYTRAEWLIQLGLSAKPVRSDRVSQAVAPFIWPIARAMWRNTITRADAVTVEAHANMPPERPDAVVIPSGVDTSSFSPDPSASPVPGRVLAVGGLYRRKGFDLLIRAIGDAAPTAHSLHLVIAGVGPERGALEKLAGELGLNGRVVFLDRVPRQMLPELYRSAVVLCHPARFDNNPTVVMEGMACGMPVLVSDAGALPEMVGGAGLVHPVGDHEALAAQIVSVIENDALRRQLGAAAREHAVRVYSLAAMCDSYLDLYQRLSALRAVTTTETKDRLASGRVAR
jgi:glycosyltransferase involved in cell wall biosynthesis